MKLLRNVVTDVGLGVPSGVAGLALLAGGLLMRRERFHGRAVRLAGWERRRLGLPPATVTGRQAVAYLVARVGPTLAGAFTVAVFAAELFLVVYVVKALVDGSQTITAFLFQAFLGGALILFTVQANKGVLEFDRWLARSLLDPGDEAELQQRITDLRASRAGAAEAVDAERRRIERDLHDGLQQRLVALSMLLGRARRGADPERSRALLDQAHTDALRAVEDLREVAWRVYPSALEQSALDEVLTMVAQRSPLPVEIDNRLPVRPPRPVETVLYFVACEAMTNAAKHARATVIRIGLHSRDGEVAMTVSDDGRGGADPAGAGLSGLARRVAALDGEFRVDSPPGGPTTIRAMIPCG